MRLSDFQLAADQDDRLDWDADNYWFVRTVIDNLKVSEYYKQVLHWAYKAGYEMLSDGETLVRDEFMRGRIKSPAGVGHDYINRTPVHTTPDGHTWTCQESNNFYLAVKKALGSSFFVRWSRYIGLTVSGFLGRVLPIKGWWR